MHYMDGIEIRLGDRVHFANKEFGEVVFSIDTDEWSPEFPKLQWQHIEKGVMFRTERGVLVLLWDPNQHEVFKLENILD